MALKRKNCLLLVGYLVVSLTHMLPSLAATNAIIWQAGDQIVQLARQDDVTAAANDHPKTATPLVQASEPGAFDPFDIARNTRTLNNFRGK